MYLVFNRTDGIYASNDEMTKKEAERFVRDFPKRFAHQGYYLTSSRVRIDPREVVLTLEPVGPDEPAV